jgi:hypothetical protein
VSDNSSLAYPVPSGPGSSAQSAYSPPGSSFPAALNLAYPPPQTDPLITVTVEAKLRLPLLSGPTYSPKKGLAWGAAHLYPYDYTRLNVSWIYNWDLEPSKWDVSSPLSDYHASDMLPGNVEFVPMIYCGTEIERAENYLGADWDGYLLFLNEPWVRAPDDCEGPMTTQEVAQVYMAIREAFPQAKLIGPNIYYKSFSSATEDPPGKLADWRDAVYTLTEAYPDVTGYAIHTYTGDPGQDLDLVADLHTFLADWQEDDGRAEPYELWVTEFGYCGDPSDQVAADNIAQTVNELEALSHVNRYAYHANRTDPRRINQSSDCRFNESANYYLFVELYGADPVNPDNPKDVCRRIEEEYGITDCNDLTYAIFEAYIDWATHFDLTLKGVAYKEAGALR